MLNYRNTVILFILVFMVLVLTGFFRPVSYWWYIGTVLILITLLGLGSACIRMGFYLSSLSSGDTDKKVVAFTFDDGPDQVNTPVLLDLLAEHGVQAAFFLIGRKVDENRNLVRRMVEEGHVIGGHSYSHHFFFDLLPSAQIENELKKTMDIIEQTTGKKTGMFRPPYGVTNPAVARSVRRLGFHSIGWSLKSKDTGITDANSLLNRLKKRVKPGDVILFHDTKPVILKVLPEFIAYLKNEKFQIVRADLLLNFEAYG